jgi:transcription initiation factor TFIIIB Brf1 subunit/transcription initiation factor TFIIB
MVYQNNSSDINETIIQNIKGISSCFECTGNNITYDESIDEIYCFTCGLVIRQGFTDYQPYIIKESETITMEIYHEELTEIKEKSKMGV